MSDLLVQLREHDLPPKWDGRPVTWRGWRDLPTDGVFICFRGKEPEPDHCKACGSVATSRVNRGTTAMRLGGKDRIIDVLSAYRCPDCHHDVVNVEDTGEWWDLDHTDYGPEGSAA